MILKEKCINMTNFKNYRSEVFIFYKYKLNKIIAQFALPVQTVIKHEHYLCDKLQVILNIIAVASSNIPSTGSWKERVRMEQ